MSGGNRNEWCSVFVSVSVIKYFDKKERQPRGRKVYEAHNSSLQSINVKKSRWKLKVALLMSGSREKINVSKLIFFLVCCALDQIFCSYTVLTLWIGNGVTNSGLDLPTSIVLITTIPHKHNHRPACVENSMKCFLGNSWLYKLIGETNHIKWVSFSL